MEIDVELSGHNETLIRTSGRLNLISAPKLQDVLAGIIGQDGRSRLVVDLTGTDFIDSTGLRALISGLKTARAAGGNLRIVGAGTQVKTVLQLTKLDRILQPSEAVESRFL
ncbi:STAS domain-containing protein [Arthrobacter rhizosphaerae]|uniref:STAS domain-containing protein n=1 Tax=Arthrobacter rhizosphaerae TaxID=2855490 RepID=UPI001FF12CC6|nr:STAS domain-containing protein [Arthrobacter rhizosphaerae]